LVTIYRRFPIPAATCLSHGRFEGGVDTVGEVGEYAFGGHAKGGGDVRGGGSEGLAVVQAVLQRRPACRVERHPTSPRALPGIHGSVKHRPTPDPRPLTVTEFDDVAVGHHIVLALHSDLPGGSGRRHGPGRD